MNCDKCPHQTKINAALSPCQSCEHGHACGVQAGNPSACEKCQHLKEIQKAMRPCGSCEAGKLHGQVYADNGNAAAAFQHAVPNDHCPMTGVTTLEPDVEDSLRKALCVIFDFTPIELLLIQHVIHGRNVGTFREPLAELKNRLNTWYDLSEDSTTFRAIAHEWKKKIVAKFPPIAELFDAVNDSNMGGCRR